MLALGYQIPAFFLKNEVPLPPTPYESFSDVGEIRVWWRADFQSGSRVLKKVFCQKVAENTQILKIAKFAM